jgi:hypothetical protein
MGKTYRSNDDYNQKYSKFKKKNKKNKNHNNKNYGESDSDVPYFEQDTDVKIPNVNYKF